MTRPAAAPTASNWLDVHKAAIRADGFMVNPYRIGLRVGRTGIGLHEPCPYTHYRSTNAYREGVRRGQEWKREAAHAALAKAGEQ